MKKESIGLFMQNGRNEKNLPMYIKSVTEGIKVMSDWDYTSNSMQCSNRERFESDFGNRILGRQWKAEKVIVQDNIAAISYPKYTDLNKFVIQNLSSGMYSAMSYSYGSYTSVTTIPMTGFILPRLNKTNGGILDLLQNDNGNIIKHNNVNLKNLFIIVEYDGYVTSNSTGEIVYESSMDGMVEIFEYNATSTDNIKSSYSFISGLDYPILNSRFFNQYGKTVNRNVTERMPNSRLNTTETALDLTRIRSTVSEQLSTIYNTSQSSIGYSFIGCKKVTFIKYTPVIECGRVDIYKKTSGRITSLLSNGRAISNSHNLIDGSIIKISGARNVNGKDINLNGFKYIQVVDSNTIDIYDDPQMINKTFTVSGVNPDAEWVAVGNVYEENTRESWRYVKSITSPTGRNGYISSTNSFNSGTVYETPNISGQRPQIPIKKMPEGVLDNYYFLLLYDIYGIDASISYPANISTIVKSFDPAVSSFSVSKRAYASSLDALWASESSFIQSCKFGSDFDLKKGDDGFYYLAIGERGPDAPQNTVEIKNNQVVPFAYPHYSPYGKVHLLKIDSAGNSIVDSYIRTISAFDSDSTIAIPEHISRSESNVSFPRDFYQFSNSELFDSQYVAAKNSISDSFLYADYWYGSLIYHLKDYDHKVPQEITLKPGGFIYDKNANGGYPFTSVYFSNFGIPTFSFSTDPENPFSSEKSLSFPTEIYPYCDSFGKSVALDIIGSYFHIACSSKTKTLLKPVSVIGNSDDRKDPYLSKPDTFYSNIDCGYIHVYKLQSEVLTKYNKINLRSDLSISGGIDTLIDKAENYAKTIKFYKNELYFGSSRASEFYDTRTQRQNGQPLSQSTVFPVNYSDKSKIFCYKLIGTTFQKSYELDNLNNEPMYYEYNSGVAFNIKDYHQNNVKETILNGINKTANKRLINYTYVTGDAPTSYTTVGLQCIVFPSDRFGDYFELNDDILCSNVLDWKNEKNIYHSDYSTFDNDPRLLLDYLHVYNKVKGNWFYVSKISASFNSANSKYNFSSINCDSEHLRDLGNFNYENNLFNSKTWDYNLSRSYAILDDRIILKDPTSYSIFRKSPQLSYATGSFEEEIVDCQPYFKFDENFYASLNQGLSDKICNFTHTKYGSLFAYNKTSTLRNFFSQDAYTAEFTTPVFFFSIPKNSGETTNNKAVIKIGIESSSGFPASLGLKLYRNDPRTTVVANYANNFTYNCTQNLDDYLISDQDPAKQNIYTLGSLSNNGTKIIYSNNYIDNGTNRIYTFESDYNDIQEFTLQNSQLKSVTLISNGQSLVLSDTSKPTYNSFVTIENTLMVGLVNTDRSYVLPNSGTSLNYTLNYFDFKMYKKRFSANTLDSRSYYCVFDKLLSYSLNISDIYCNLNSSRSIGSILAVGNSYEGSSTCNSFGDISKSISVFSIDNIYGSNVNYSDKLYGDYFTAVKTVDVNHLNYLSLNIASNFQSNAYTSLYTDSAYTDSNSIPINMQSSLQIDDSVNLFLGPSVYLGDCTLYLKTPNVIIEPDSGSQSSQSNLFMLAGVKSGEYINARSTLYTRVVETSADATIFIATPMPFNNQATLFFSSGKEYVASSVCNSPKLFLFGSYKQDSNITLEMSGNKPETISLNISGPTSINTGVNLFMDSRLQALSNSADLVCFQKPNSGVNLFIDVPELVLATSTLHIDYTVKNVNSINNGLNTFCNMVASNQIFDVSSFMSERLTNRSNSLVDKVFSNAYRNFGSLKSTKDLSEIKTDYEFYRYGRNQTLIHWNSNYLVFGVVDFKTPYIHIYNLNGKQISAYKEVMLFIPDSSINIKDCYIQDIKISSWGDIAVSYYIETMNSAGVSSGGKFEIAILTSSGVLIKRITRDFIGFSEDLFLSNCMGLSLLFHNNKLFYTHEKGYDTFLVSCDKTNYNPIEVQSFMGNFLGSDRENVEKNIMKGYVPYNRPAFGHKIEVTQSGEMLISAPLFNRNLLTQITEETNSAPGGGVSGGGLI
jgi:hypothetical protein